MYSLIKFGSLVLACLDGRAKHVTCGMLRLIEGLRRPVQSESFPSGTVAFYVCAQHRRVAIYTTFQIRRSAQMDPSVAGANKVLKRVSNVVTAPDPRVGAGSDGIIDFSAPFRGRKEGFCALAQEPAAKQVGLRRRVLLE